jgi:hypothetical protein
MSSKILWNHGKGKGHGTPLVKIEILGKREREELMKWLKGVEWKEKKEKGHRGRASCYDSTHTSKEKPPCVRSDITK